MAYNTFSRGFMSLSESDFQFVGKLILDIESGAISSESQLRETSLGDQLLSSGFIVQDEVDERSLVGKRYFEYKDATQHLSLTIAPTINCNFGCTYCFQEHPNKKMSAENIRDIKQHVENNLKSDTGLHITWFGGEPLMGLKMIKELAEFFSDICIKRNCDYTQSMVTNGSLMVEAVINYIEQQGNYRYVQITLDGPPQIHNLRRAFSGGKASFEKILANIEAAKGRINITLRVNVDKRNYHHLSELVSLLSERNLLDTVSMYLGRVTDYTEVCGDEVKNYSLSVPEFAEVESRFEFCLLEHGVRPSASLPEPKFGNFCGADNPNSFLFSPEGLVFKCWNEAAESTKEASGILKNGEIVVKVNHVETKSNWDNYNSFQYEKCDSCSVQPLCQGGCPWEARRDKRGGTESCITDKWNLPDRLRMYHLLKTIDNYPLDELQQDSVNMNSPAKSCFQ